MANQGLVPGENAGLSPVVMKAMSDSSSPVHHLCLHPSNKVALSVGHDRTLRLWNLVKGSIGFVRKLKFEAWKVLFSPDASEYVLLATNKIIVYKTADGEESFTLENNLGWNDVAYLAVGLRRRVRNRTERLWRWGTTS